MKLWCNKTKWCLTQAALVACWHLTHCAVETLICIAVFDRKRSLLHHKKLGKNRAIAGI